MSSGQSRGEWPIAGPWSREQIHQYLDACRTPIRIACLAPSGYPTIVSMWYVFDGERLWSATHREARIVRLLTRDSRVGFEVAGNEMPYQGVRGNGEVQLHVERGADILDCVMSKYLQKPGSGLERWLRSRSADEVAIELVPTRVSAWDYGGRMADAY